MPKPFAVLRYLAEHAGRLVTQDELLTAIWPDTYVQPEVLRRYVLEIRRVLGDSAQAPRFLATRPKRGYQFIAAVTDASVASPVDAPMGHPRLVGRTSVLADLDRYLQLACRGQRQLVFVLGEPGIGKTSLVDAFQRTCAVQPGVAVARGQSMEGFAGKEAYFPILEALGQLARGASAALVVETLNAVAPTWLIQFPALVRVEQRAALQREILGATRERMVRELCEALEAISTAVALVIVLEDLHWADHSTLDLLSAIARRREPAKLLVLGTFRPADVILSESPLKALRHDLGLHQLSRDLELAPLGEDDVVAFLAAELGTADLPDGLPRVLHRHSDGNPLFLTAMLDHLVQQGVLGRAENGWALTVPIDQIELGVPETLRQMLEIQLQHSSDEDRRLLECASVAGHHFTAWAVATMLEREPTSIERRCDTLAGRQQFIRSAALRELANGQLTPSFEFRHALYREVLYRRLSPTERVRFHRSLAIALERLHSPVEPETAAHIAGHFEAGREHERAIPYLMLAAQNATRRYAYVEAVALLEHAYGLLPRVPDEGRRDLDLELLERLGNAFYAQGDMARSAEAYDRMATRAAGTGRLPAQAAALMRSGHPAAAIPFFARAIALDPDLVVAYTSLSRIYSNLGEADRAREYARLAYERRAHADERERLSVTYQYHFEVTGDQALASQTLEEWKQAFPKEFQAANSLALIHNFLGHFEAAIEEGREAVRRNPSHGFPYSNLSHAYRGLGRFDDARRTAERAVEIGVETLPTRRLLYHLAVLDGDGVTAQRHLDWARDQPREFDVIGARAQVAGWSGRVAEARRLYDEAAAMAERRQLPDVGTSHLAWATSMEVAYGNLERAASGARAVLARGPSYDPQLRAALALAMSGSMDEAEAITHDLSKNNPDHTLINAVLAPIVKAGVELARRRPAAAIDALRLVAPYELGFIAALAPIHLRASACLMLGDAAAAIAQFQRLLGHRGSDPFSPFHAVAPLGLARALILAGDVSAAAETYERFLTAWADADADVPVLIEAHAEHARLARR
jgi:tetratricopeptide (TPR) repeat protein